MPERHNRIKAIYLDMDGVLFNFVKGFCDKYNFDMPPLNTWDIHEELGITLSEFIHKLSEMDYHDWYNLKPIPHGFKLYFYLRTLDIPVYFCSSPSRNPESWWAKRAKLDKYFPENSRNTILVHDKYLLAREDALLIDDSQKNIDLFREHGGNAIAFPQNYNENKGLIDKSYAVQKIMELKKWNI